jgi:agmatinase
MMDPEKLARIRALSKRRLRDELQNTWLKDYYDPVTEEDSEDIDKPFSGIFTFFRAPRTRSLDNIDIALIGVPFDLGVTNRAGARHGPGQIREMSALTDGPMHHQSNIIPEEHCEFIDYGDVPFETLYELDKGIREIEAFYHRVCDAGVIPLSAGGDHSITYPILEAVGRDQPVGLVHIDAHCDTMGEYAGSKFHHGGPFRNAAVAGVLDPERTIQIGIRGRAEPLWAFSYDTGMRVVHMEEFYEMGIAAVVAEIHRVCGDGPTYISFDVDGLDPAFAPGTGTPEIGGISTFDGQQIIRGCRGLNLVGGDVVEVAPPFDPSGNTALVGATFMWEILCVLSDAIATRRKTPR